MSSATIAASAAAVLEDSFKPPLKTLHPQSSTVTSSTSTASITTNTSESSSSSIDEEAATIGSQDYNDTTTKLHDDYFSDTRINQMNKRAQEENEGLHLNLGLPLDLTVFTRRDNTTTNIVQKVLRPPIQILLRLLDRLLGFIESPLFRFWSNRVPLRLRQRLTFLAWGMYLPIHKALIGRRTGLHRDVSLEYHALTSVMWWGRLFPMTIKRMRFSLSQLHTCHPPDKYPQWNLITNSSSRDTPNKPTNGEQYGIHGHLHEVYHQMKQKRTPTGSQSSTPKEPTTAEMTVTGKYIQHASRPSQKVLFWIYGGAFLAGDSRGNMGIAEKMGMLCAAGSSKEEDSNGGSDMRDVFIPDYRLVPEHHLDDATHDITLAFEYLIYERGVKPEDVTLVGVSSGGGLVVLLMQAIAKAQREFDERKGVSGRVDDNGSSYCVPIAMPAGGVMMGPFVDYTEPKGSMKEYIKHDLIVNQSVYDVGIPYLEKVLGCHENRVRASPVYGNFEGLPPLCICVSEHEVVYDQAMLLAKRAREQGVDVTVGVWKYM